VGAAGDKDRLEELLLDALGSGLEPREVRRRGPDGLAEIAASALPFVAARLAPGELRVRVHEPGGQRRGRSVVEVLASDQPFLFDTFRLTLDRLGMKALVAAHPLLEIERADDGSIARVGGGHALRRESFIYAELPEQAGSEARGRIESELARSLGSAQAVVADHGRMLGALRRHVERIGGAEPAPRTAGESAGDSARFLLWLEQDNFLFLGYRHYRVSRPDGDWRLDADPDSGLGLMRDTSASRFAGAGAQVPEQLRARLADARVIFFDKSRSESTVHRHGRLDSIAIKELDADGRITGFGRFVGLLTHKALRLRPGSIPILERRLAQVLDALHTQPGSHLHKAAVAAFDSLPVEFLFQFAFEDVVRAVQRVVAAGEHRSLEVCVAPDPRNRSFFVSAVMPRRAYDERLRADLHELLAGYGTTYLDHRTSFIDDEIALIHFFGSSAQDVDPVRLAALERSIRERASCWDDAFAAALLEARSEERARALADAYLPAFDPQYRAANPPREAALDVAALLELERSGGCELRFESSERELRLKVYRSQPAYLTDLLPVLDHFGLRVRSATTTQVRAHGSPDAWILAFELEPLPASGPACESRAERLLAGLRESLAGRVESDALSRLILDAGIDWRACDALRAYAAWWEQLGTAPARSFIAEVLLRRGDATRALIELFHARFDPDLAGDRAAHEAAACERIARARQSIPSASEDRVLAAFESMLRATTRTNFWIPRAEPGPHELAFKLDPARVEQMPRPWPWAEIFVHSAEMAGVHLRGGRVARGGIRWSDRPLDFRREILGLMRAQMAKNGVIVPVGAKGGFALKRPPADAKAVRAEADRIYARFITQLLALADDQRGGRVIPPERVVRHDGDDPYLVVAADKGTAHLSDTANRIACARGFWLGDAFASGGSNGYDHKALGITAAGAWTCARRHFLELGRDPERDGFSMIGIGDMSGDVFGNGLLLARRGRLLAAFNHAHVFVDPDPDAELAWRERKRLFELPASSWKDYDPERISEGGGVWERGARSIRLHAQVRKLLGVEAESVSGEELVRAILRLPVDLLWNGGIGTYVKASSESHADAADRANDAVRIDARELRARVVAEGGNLGFTQRARVEYALGGGRINTDALDNSGGVDLSDHEVNYKLLLARALETGQIAPQARNALLRECAPEACALVLQDSAAQSRCVSLDQIRSWQDPERLALATDYLAAVAGLDPAREFLPDREALTTRASQSGARRGFTRSEVALLLGYTKGLAKRELIASSAPDHPSVESLYRAYFPARLQRELAAELPAHPLRREIAATALANRVLDRAGVTLVPELVLGVGASVAEVIAAYHSADLLLRADELRELIESLPIAETLRLRARLRVEDGVRLLAGALLGIEQGALLDARALERWRAANAWAREILPSALASSERALLARAAKGLVDRGVPADIAQRVEHHCALARCSGSIALALELGIEPDELHDLLELHGRIGERTRITWLLARLEQVELPDGWSRISAESLYLEMLQAQRDLVRRAWTADASAAGASHDVLDPANPRLRQIEASAAQIESSPPALTPLIVLGQQIRRL
jgi:glutamate dehydrogenase